MTAPAPATAQSGPAQAELEEQQGVVAQRDRRVQPPDRQVVRAAEDARLEHGRLDRPHDPVGRVGRQPVGTGDREPREAPEGAAALGARSDRVAEVEARRAAGGHDRVHHQAQVVGAPAVVRVEEGDPRVGWPRPRPGCAPPSCRRCPGARSGCGRGTGRTRCGRVVGRPVVHHDDLVGRAGLLQDRLDRPGDERAAVVGRDDRGDERLPGRPRRRQRVLPVLVDDG